MIVVVKMTKAINTGLIVNFRNGMSWKQRKLWKEFDEATGYAYYFIKYNDEKLSVWKHSFRLNNTTHVVFKTLWMNECYIENVNGDRLAVEDIHDMQTR